MQNAKIINLAAHRQGNEAEAKFLGLIDCHVAADPAAVKPIPSSLLARIDRLSDIVAKAKQEQLLEG